MRLKVRAKVTIFIDNGNNMPIEIPAIAQKTDRDLSKQWPLSLSLDECIEQINQPIRH